MNKDNHINRSMIEVGIPISDISNLAKYEGNSKKPIYMIHKWWARRLSSVVRSIIIGATLPETATPDQFWDKFYSKNDLSKLTIMDPFMGGGTCVVEAKKMNAKVIGIDVDPLASFITQKELESIDNNKLIYEFNRIINNLEKINHKYYSTQIGKKLYPVVNYFWVYSVSCEKCEAKIYSHPHYYLAKDKKYIYAFCKHCGQIEKLHVNRKRLKCSSCLLTTDIYKGSFQRGRCTCNHCNHTQTIADKVNGIRSLTLFALEYIDDNGERVYKKADSYDHEIYNCSIKEFSEYANVLTIPSERIPHNISGDCRPHSHGFNFYKDLFNERQLLILGFLLYEISQLEPMLREWFLLAFSDCLASNNMLCCYAYGYKKLTPLFGIHSYTVPARPAENNVLGTDSLGRGSFKKVFNKLIRAKKYCNHSYEIKLDESSRRIKIFTGETISAHVTNNYEDFKVKQYDGLILNKNSEDLQEIANSSVDIILTDPPYYDNLAYSDLSSFYYVWLKNFLNNKSDQYRYQSIFVSPDDRKNHNMYIEQLSNVFNQCMLKLKQNGIMIFSYHHKEQAAWTSLAEAIKINRFQVTNVFPIKSEGSSAYHSSSESIKWDSIIVLRKWNASVRIDEPDYDNWNIICIKTLEMKKCDILSFYRSIALQKFVNSDRSIQDVYLEAEGKVNILYEEDKNAPDK